MLNNYCYLFDGIEFVDLVIIDVYKQLYILMGVGMVLFKNLDVMYFIEYYVQYILCKGLKDFGSYILEGFCFGMVMLVYVSMYIISWLGYELLID